MTYRYLSLFSGIGGFELAAQIANEAIGLEAFEPVALCEINPKCQEWLHYRFPTLPIFSDVKGITDESLRGLESIDGIVGGFPCQDISGAGAKAGISEGTRSGLFYEIIRIASLVRPRFIILENVRDLVIRGMGIVLRELSRIGYDAVWSVVSCAEVGGSHTRKSLWLVAYPNSQSKPESIGQTKSSGNREATRMEPKRKDSSVSIGAITDSKDQRLEAWQRGSSREETIGVAERSRRLPLREEPTQPAFCRGDDGFSFRMAHADLLLPATNIADALPYSAIAFKLPDAKEMLQAYGSAIVPQVGAIAFLKAWKILQQQV